MTVGSHQGLLPALLGQMGTTRSYYLTSSDCESTEGYFYYLTSSDSDSHPGPLTDL